MISHPPPPPTPTPTPTPTQVYNNYGPRSNRRLLLDFGFVMQDNPFDFIEIKCEMSAFVEETRAPPS